MKLSAITTTLSNLTVFLNSENTEILATIFPDNSGHTDRDSIKQKSKQVIAVPACISLSPYRKRLNLFSL